MAKDVRELEKPQTNSSEWRRTNKNKEVRRKIAETKNRYCEQKCSRLEFDRRIILRIFIKIIT